MKRDNELVFYCYEDFDRYYFPNFYNNNYQKEMDGILVSLTWPKTTDAILHRS